MAWTAPLVALALLAGCTSPPPRPQTSQERTSAPSPTAEVAASALGAKWSWGRLDPAERYLQRMPKGPTMYELVWCDIESDPGQRDWDRVDRIVRLSRELGYTVNLKIRVGACWATQEGPEHVRGAKRKSESHLPRDMNAYRDFVRAVAERYAPHGVRQFAVENEPDAEWFWGGTVEQLTTLARVAAKAIHSADPAAEVVSWGVSSPTYGLGVASRLLARGEVDQAVAAYNAYFARRPAKAYPQVSSVAELREVLREDSAVRNLNYVRAAERLLAEGVFDVRQVHFYEPSAGVPALLEYLHATTPRTAPIEVWEAGQYWPDGPSDPQLRAAEATRTVTLLLAGGVRRVIWLPLLVSEEHSGPEKRYGLLDPGGEARPAADAYRRLAELSADSSAAPVDTAGLRGVALEDGSDTALVLWSEAGRTLQRPSGMAVSAQDLTGRPVNWRSDGLRVTRQPVFLEVGADRARTLQLLAP